MIPAPVSLPQGYRADKSKSAQTALEAPLQKIDLQANRAGDSLPNS